MRDFVLAVAVFATIATSTAIDEECIKRRLRGLPLHWPNPIDCASFYRCTNKNIKRELLCPEGKEYNPNTGRCAQKGFGLCKLSLAAPLAESVDNTCEGKNSGTFMPDSSSCRDFYLCHDNKSYPQTCDPGSYFNADLLFCTPDRSNVCWENLCVNKTNGSFVANDKDCHSFYVCDNQKPITQRCDENSYFNAKGLYCQPGKCPSEETTTTPASTETSTSTREGTTKPSTGTTTTSAPTTTTTCAPTTTTTCAPTTTTTCAPATTTTCASTTTTCAPTTTTTCASTTTTTCAPTTTTCTPTTTTTCAPTTTTTCAPTTTTCAPTTTTTCAPTTTTTCAPTTTTCAPTTTTTCAPTTTTTCAPTTTTTFTSTRTTTCAPTTTTTCTPITTTTCAPETTTKPCVRSTTTTCKPETTTRSTTTVCQGKTSTTCAQQATTTPAHSNCSAGKCDGSKCLKAKNGFVFDALNTNSGFCVCFNGIAEYRACPDEATFDKVLEICVAQDKVCPSSKCSHLPNYSTFPASNTTRGFCGCFGGIASFHECAGTNFVYDNVLGICVASHTKEPNKLCAGSYKEGDFVPNPDSCMLFYICFEGKLEEVSCDSGSYFEDQVKACLPDTDNKCPACHQAQTFLNNRRHKRSIRLSTCPEGAKTPADDCDKYYKCSKGHKLLYGCGKANFFNVTTLACELDEQHVCWPVNSCTEGDRNPYPGDNTKYYECLNGKQVVMSCDSQKIFNKLTKCCVARRECTCPGGYKQDEISPHPTDCEKFYICSEGEQLLQDCGKGNYFNQKTLKCEKDVDNICHAREECLCPGGYKEGAFSAHPNDCDKYYVCKDGKQILHECGRNNYFDEDTLRCKPDIYNLCWTKKDCTCPGGYKEGDFSAHPTDCNKYYVCHDSKQILEDCGTNNYFDNDTLSCKPDVYHICWPNLCAGQPNGALVANPQQCNSLFLCENNEAIPKACFEGQRFDPSSGACVADLKAVCYNPCANETTGPVVLLLHPICNEYYFCNGHKTFVGTCMVGSFDIETGVCNENKKCFPNPCDNPNVTVFPDPYDPTRFYWCNPQRKPIPYDCPEGTEFNTKMEVCQKYSDPDCPPCAKDGAYSTLDNTNDSEFCVCNDGLATKIECSQGYVFNQELGVCYSNAPCDPSFCLDAEEYTTAPNRNDSKSFCMCFNKKPVIIDCPKNGTFNPYTLECSDYEISPECLQSTCIGVKNNNHVFAPINTKTSNGFCQCINQIATFKPCSYGSTFNPDLVICQLAEINCNSYQCRGLPDKTIVPSVSTTQGYCECNNNVATYQNCPNNGEFNATTSQCEAPQCDLSQCTGPQATKYPFPASKPDGFCLCSVGFVPCETEGTIFSNTFGICIDPCPQASCDGKPDKYLVSSALNIHSFCMCHTLPRMHPTFELCPSESFKFEETQQMCVPNSEKLCGTSPCRTPGAFAAKDTLTGFCLCTAVGAKPSFKRCEGGVFVPETSACMPTAKDVCDVKLCARATLEHPITLPANSSISEFCYCSSPTNVMLLPCPYGKYYSQSKAMCVSEEHENCKCPNNIVENEKVADPTTCNKYSICIKGVMQPQTCPNGAYFNVKVKDCVPDTTGICAKKSQCTCLGIYYENELLAHPVNPQMYYACQANTLHEYKCQDGHIFSAAQKQCIVNDYSRQKRSADLSNDHEFGCVENEKRSVPSNCSQYEICHQFMWQRQTCPNFYYYNPEQKQCIEPRDDFVCSYAKVTSLPACNASVASVLPKTKSCQLYYRCKNEKWRLKSCGRKQYFDAKLSSCLAIPEDTAPSFRCDSVRSNSSLEAAGKCQHLSQRFYAKNCAMYLICLDNEWWYQHCPAGMHYNRSLNWCTPDVRQQCKDVVRTEPTWQTKEFSLDTCQKDGLLRPSALACNRYFICVNGKWQMQRCSLGEFYDVANARCSADLDGICSQLNRDCLPNERTLLPRNCSAYKQCSGEGKWLAKTCPAGEAYDEFQQQCIRNKHNICSKLGLKRTCRENELVSVQQNCSLFLYCYQDTWHLGSCLKGFMYSEENRTCVAHMPEDKCKPFNVEQLPATGLQLSPEQNLCANKSDGTWVANLTDCSCYSICIRQAAYQVMQCPKGSFFDANLGYCRPNDGSCRLPLTGICANANEGSLIAHHSDCQAYYNCSSISGTELQYCVSGQYFDSPSKQCLIDRGECKKTTEPKQICAGVQHGKRLAHETYCNIYYTCVKDLAFPSVCPNNQRFDSALAKCIVAKDHSCHYGHLKEETSHQNCSQLANGTFLADLQDCTRYFICSEGKAFAMKCSHNNYFDNEQMLCVPNDGSCPYVDTDSSKNQTAPPDPLQCEGKHGHLMADPLNCNNFYVCIHNKLKHERCYAQQFFNSTAQQCQQKEFLQSLATNNATENDDSNIANLKIKTFQCLDEPSSPKNLCSEMPQRSSLSEPGDCRRFITCQEPDEEPLSQRCRNGESFDSLLGFCRQNDGTCLMENGQRVGECSGKHGQLARDSNNCRNYFVCINGQKISQTCESGKYFSKAQNMCIPDTQHVCKPSQQPEEYTTQSCAGLSESVLYPYVYDNCRSYFQCIQGIAKIHKCADDLYFDPIAIKCIQNKTECIMPTRAIQRSPAFSQAYKKLCSNRKLEQPYSYVANDCHSFYICHENGTVSHELCPLGMMFSQEENSCVIFNKTSCTASKENKM